MIHFRARMPIAGDKPLVPDAAPKPMLPGEVIGIGVTTCVVTGIMHFLLAPDLGWHVQGIIAKTGPASARAPATPVDTTRLRCPPESPRQSQPPHPSQHNRAPPVP
jgi:hypothetical protein